MVFHWRNPIFSLVKGLKPLLGLAPGLVNNFLIVAGQTTKNNFSKSCLSGVKKSANPSL